MSECKFCNARDNDQGRINADLPILTDELMPDFLEK